jgi:predicted MFS family arabinose efflux permease
MARHTTTDLPRTPTAPPYALLAGVGIAVLVLSTAAFFRVPLLPEIGRDLAMAATQLGIVTSMFAAGRLLTDLPAGRLLERLHPTTLLAGSAALMAVGSLALAGAGAALAVYAAAFVMGISSAVTNATGMHAFSVSVPARRRGTALAIFSTALLGGQSLGPLTAGGIAAASSWRVALVVASIASGLLMVAMLVIRHRTRRRPAPRPTDEAAHGPGTADPPDSAHHDAGAGAQWALLAVAFAMFFTLGAMPQTLIPLIGADQLQLRVSTVGLALGVGGACRLAGGFIGGTIADRVSRRAALLPGLVLQAVGVMLVIGRGVAWWLGGIVVMSLASWSISVGATVLADLTPEGALGPRLGRFRFSGDVGLVAGPLIATQVFARVGPVPTMAAIAGLLIAAAVWCAVSVPETRVPT